MREVTEIGHKLILLMKEVGLLEKTAAIIATNLKNEQQEQKMFEYITEHKNIITDHQALQHLEKVLRGIAK